jgi:hypothetical protein
VVFVQLLQILLLKVDLRRYPWICCIFEAFYLSSIGEAFLSHAFLVSESSSVIKVIYAS